MTERKTIWLADEQGFIRGEITLTPMYVHTNRAGDTFLTYEGAAGMEHDPERCAAGEGGQITCQRELEIIAQSDIEVN
jgi:hypothetical protein